MMESLTSNVQYAYLQPLKIPDEIVVDVSKNQGEIGSTDSPALMPIKEEVASKDLRSYFVGKLLFDEPDSLPIIWLEVQPTRNDFAIKKKKTRKHTQPTAAQSSQKKQRRRQRSIKRKKKVERKVSCQSCDRKFVTIDDMKIHAATHLRKRQKDCFICGRRFRHGGALCLHMRSHKFARLKK